MGIWLIAPRVLRLHHLEPATWAEWLVFDAALLAGSIALGMVLSLIAGLVIIGWALARRRPYDDLTWTVALALGPFLPVAYISLALAIEWIFFRRVPPIGTQLAWWRLGIVACALAGVVAVRTYRRVTTRAVRSSPASLAWALAGATVLGALALPWRVATSAPPSVIDGGALTRAAEEARAATPLLLIGLDSGNWETLRPLIERGSVPTIAGIIAEGMHGIVEALWPPYWSGPAWAAILTGHPREENGIYADLTIRAPGLPLFDAPLDGDFLLDPFLLMEWWLLGWNVVDATPPPRSALERPPVWELLTSAGVESGVVRFDFAYPAERQAAFIISNRVGRDTWELAQVRPSEGSGVVAPASRAEELLAPFSEDVPFDPGSFADLLAGANEERDPYVKLGLDMLRTALDIDRRTLDASERILRMRPDLPFLAVYLGGFDNVCHAFWPYRFPEAYGDARPSAADVARFGAVIDRYLEFLDRGLGRLVAAYSSRPNVMILSDHGHEAALDHPLWRGWHGRLGVFLARGPGFAKRAQPVAVGYYDVVPTIADVMGFAVPDGMHGTSVARRQP